MPLLIRHLGQQAYEPIWKQMQERTLARNEHSQDEIWLLQHPPVYTLGLNGKRHHLIHDNAIPIIPIDRGGQVTYHGPGQSVAYLLCDIERMGIGANDFVNRLEQSLIDLIADYSIKANRIPGAPGVYVDGRKIAALGLRIKRGRTYHGLSLNIDMDLGPFKDINPCGYPDLEVTQLKDLGVSEGIDTINKQLIKHLQINLGYNEPMQITNIL